MTVDEGARTVTPGRAAQELELRREEFRLAVQLGLVRTVPTGEGGGPRRIERCELDRLRAAPDFPTGLRERVRAVGTAEAAALLEITPDRFTRLARTGHVSPVRFCLNRYRAVVWTYLAEEVADFGLACPALLTGRMPLDLRERLAAHEDLRPRNWRARRLAVLLRTAGDPWVRAAAVASQLDPVQVAEVVDDPYERAHLDRLRPPPPPGMPGATAAREIAERLTRADDPDEILWQRLSLAMALDEARAERPAPYPGDAGAAVPGVAAGAWPRGRVPVSSPRVPAGAPESIPSSQTPVVPVPVGDAAPPVRVRAGRAAPQVPAQVSAPAQVPVPVPAPGPGPVQAGPPTPGASAPHVAVTDRPPARSARTRLLDRFRRRRPDTGRPRGRRRPVSWP
ncbi:DUF6397 family protein [Streptomyces sp. MSC1_001]|jgi:hypothetical protein|uniref:DUF6397 family protein n=1 Tax=Streptomyces sp. MSC1_001 TaxID=2909263 RepID=UPI00202F051E|nr:DUF6397 family protein [Streptomyces sp. MSC1_001]